MRTKIKSVTIIAGENTKTYTLGETYNGLVLHRITDYSTDYEDSQHIKFMGFTDGGSPCFQVINAPMDVQYEELEDE